MNWSGHFFTRGTLPLAFLSVITFILIVLGKDQRFPRSKLMTVSCTPPLRVIKMTLVLKFLTSPFQVKVYSSSMLFLWYLFLTDDEILFGVSGLPGTSTDLGLPPRPPSVRSKDKSVRSTTPGSEKDVFSPTPSSGHYSAGSTSFLSKSPGDKTDSVIPRLRSEIDHLKKRFSQSERDWAEVNK